MSRRKCLQFQDTLITLSFDGACVVYPYNYCVWSCLLLFVCLILFLFFCFVLFFVFCHTFVFLASAFYTYWRGYVGKTNEFFLHIPMGTNCVPLLADLFLYSYEAYFIQGLLKKNEKKLARSFKFTFSYIDDVLSLNNSRFGDFVDRIYPIELEIKDTTDTDRSVGFIPWPTPRNWQWGAVKNETLRQKRWFQFSNCELSIYM